MTKKELLKLLKDVPDDGLIVVNDGYGEYEDINQIMTINLVCDSPSGCGTYSDSRWFGISKLEKAEIIKAYVIR